MNEKADDKPILARRTMTMELAREILPLVMRMPSVRQSTLEWTTAVGIAVSMALHMEALVIAAEADQDGHEGTAVRAVDVDRLLEKIER